MPDCISSKDNMQCVEESLFFFFTFCSNKRMLWNSWRVILAAKDMFGSPGLEIAVCMIMGSDLLNLHGKEPQWLADGIQLRDKEEY
jgi:hypothetical protein